MTSCTMCAKDFPKEYKYCPLCGVPFANSSDPHYWGRKALTSRLDGEDLAVSIEALKKACELAPDNAHLMSGLGNLYYRAGELELSIESLKKAIAMKPDYPDAHYDLALSYYRTGQINLAIKSLEKCVELSRDYLAAYYWLGIS